MPEAINSGLNERYAVGLVEDPDISLEARERLLSSAPPEIRSIFENEMKAKTIAIDTSYPLAVKKYQC